MNAGTICNILPLLQTLVWPLLIAGVLIFLRKPLKSLADRFSGPDSMALSIGPLKVILENMQQVRANSAELSKTEIQEFIDSKIREIHASIVRQTTRAEVRLFPRVKTYEGEEIIITREDGTEARGVILDISSGGISFQSNQSLRWGETIWTSARNQQSDVPIQNSLRIIRKDQLNDSMFEYGGAFPAANQSAGQFAKTA